jgi:hypothetical protein
LDPLLADVADEPMLSKINETLLRAICARLGMATPIRRCTDLLDRELMRDMEPTDRLVELAQSAGADRYLSGPAAKAYLDVSAFRARGIDVAWMSYDGYPDYPQLWGAFEPQVSMIDVLFNTGEDAAKFMTRDSAK